MECPFINENHLSKSYNGLNYLTISEMKWSEINKQDSKLETKQKQKQMLKTNFLPFNRRKNKKIRLKTGNI